MAESIPPYNFQPIPPYNLNEVKSHMNVPFGLVKGARISADHVHHNRAAIEQNRNAIQDTRQEIAKMQKGIPNDSLEAKQNISCEVVRIQETINTKIAELNANIVKVCGSQVVEVSKEALLKDPELLQLFFQALNEKQREVYESRIKELEKKVEELSQKARL